MQIKTIAGHELTPGKTVKDHIHVEGTELRGNVILLPLANRSGFENRTPGRRAAAPVRVAESH